LESGRASGEGVATGELRVGDWVVRPSQNELRRGEQVVRVEPKAIEVLVRLARRPGEVVGREELLSAVWPGVIVGDDALTQAIIKLRKAFDDDAHRPRYIETISKRGYRLIATVEGAGSSAEPAVARAKVRRPLKRWWWVLAALALLSIAAVPLLRKVVPMPWPLAEDVRGQPRSFVQPLIAVLPFTNASDDPRKEYLSDGITEDIIGALGRSSGLRVMSRNAVQPYRHKDVALSSIRDELKARYIVRGSVREAGGRLRVSIELSDADKGVLLWSDRYEGQGAEIFAMQDRIVRDMAAALHVKVTQLEQQRLESSPTENLEAHDLLLRARSLLNQIDRTSNREARALLARALELAPDYADILVYMGEAEIQRALFGWVEDPSVSMHRAEELARLVLASPAVRSHARAELLLARYHSNLGRPEEARVHSERALALNPADPDALYWKGAALLYVGRVEESVIAMEEARRFDPQLNAASGVNLVMGYFMAGRYQDAIALADILLSRYPRDVGLHAARTAAYSQLGDEANARAAAEQVRRFSPFYRTRFAGERFLKQEHKDKYRLALQRAGL